MTRHDLGVLAAGLAATGLVTVLLRLLPHVSPTSVALVLLLVVLATATIGRLRVALVVSVGAMLVFNFYFLPPVRTFVIADPENWVALAVFLIVAVTAANLSAAAQARAREAERADLSATLLASLSHDLRTPLTVMRTAMENLSGDLTPADRRGQAEAGVAEVDRLTRLVQDILEMARVDAGAIRPEKQWVSPSEVIDAAVAHVKTSVIGHPLDVEAEADREVEIDPRLVSVALAHLLENAARYSPEGSPIHVRGAAEGDSLALVVTDRGPGLHTGEVDHVFERFFRGRAGQRHPGSGMGLSIARGLLTAAGGHVRAENAPGAGARFSVTVPGRVRVVATGA